MMDELYQDLETRIMAALNDHTLDSSALRELLAAALDGLWARRAEIHAMRDELDLARVALDSLPNISVYAKDVNGRKIFANKVDAALMGVKSPEEALGKSDFDVYPPEMAAQFAITDYQVMTTRVPILDTENMLLDADGGELWWTSSKFPLLDRHGNVIGVFGVGRNITTHKLTERQLRQSEREYKMLFDAALRQAQELTLMDQVRTLLAREIDLQVVARTVCEAVASTFGYTHVSVYLREGDAMVLKHQIGYDSVIERIPISDGVIGRVVRTGRAALLEDVTTDRDFMAAVAGVTSEICVPLRDDESVVGVLNIESTGDKQFTHADLDLMSALSEHVSIAINRARLVAEMRQSEAHMRALLEAVPDTILRFDRDGRYLDYKPNQDAVRGMPREEVIGKHITEIVPKEIAEEALLTMKLALSSRRTQIHEYSRLGNDGILRWFEARYVPTQNSDEVLVIVRNITDRKNAERHRVETERMTILKELFDNLSHDLRTPIASIFTSVYLLNKQNERLLEQIGALNARLKETALTSLALLAEGGEIEASALRLREQTRSLDESAHRLRRMVESMTEMARLDGRPTPIFAHGSLNRVTQQALDMLLPLAAEKGVHLNAHLDLTIPSTLLDDDEFIRVAQNLIENAINYTPHDGSVTISTYRSGSSAVLEVRDTGIGIGADDLPNIFNRLYRADKARSSHGGGMGLGLAIVKRIVEAHGGSISVESQLGVGSTFWVRLPLIEEQIDP